MKPVNIPLFLVGCVAAVSVALAQPPHSNLTKEPTVLKAVVHVNFGDPDRQEAGLKNIENILKEVGRGEIIVVCHGDGISLLAKKDAKHADLVQALMKQDVRFAACENTMKKKSLEKSDLLEGSTTVPSGAVEVIQKQNSGFGYFRP